MFNAVFLVTLGELGEDVLNSLFKTLLSVIDRDLHKELLTLSAFQTTVGAYRFDPRLQIVLGLTDTLWARFTIDSQQDTQPVWDILTMFFIIEYPNHPQSFLVKTNHTKQMNLMTQIPTIGGYRVKHCRSSTTFGNVTG